MLLKAIYPIEDVIPHSLKSNVLDLYEMLLVQSAFFLPQKCITETLV